MSLPINKNMLGVSRRSSELITRKNINLFPASLKDFRELDAESKSFFFKFFSTVKRISYTQPVSSSSSSSRISMVKARRGRAATSIKVRVNCSSSRASNV